MKKVLFFLLGLVCDTYACVQFNELDAGGGWKNAILLCVMLIAAGYLFSKMTDKNTVPRYLVQGLHFAFCLCMLLCAYTEAFPVYNPGEMIADILYSRSLSILTALSVNGLILLLAVLYISSCILEQVRTNAGQIVLATAALLLATLTADACYKIGFSQKRRVSVHGGGRCALPEGIQGCGRAARADRRSQRNGQKHAGQPVLMRKSDEICHFSRKMRASMPVVWYDKSVALCVFAQWTKKSGANAKCP